MKLKGIGDLAETPPMGVEVKRLGGGIDHDGLRTH